MILTPKLAKIVDSHEPISHLEDVAALLDVDTEEVLRCVLALIHSADHEEIHLCQEGFDEAIQLLLGLGIEAGKRLAHQHMPHQRWRN